ncbi:MAG TPA: hypothetical protein VL122_00550 [Nitrospirota bacterium]|nr:hypothetical protein [Nitrospirota bacterium]
MNRVVTIVDYGSRIEQHLLGLLNLVFELAGPARRGEILSPLVALDPREVV